MKTPCLYLLMAIVMIACRTKNEPIAEISEIMFDQIAEPPAMNAPPPAKEMVKFVPPVIKDDAMEESILPQSGAKQQRAKKIIKDGSISIKVKEVESAKKQMDVLVKKAGGYYENEEFQNYEPRSQYTLKVRVPSAKFETFLSATEKSGGEVVTKTINTRDVTEEYVDTEIRLESKRLFRKRYNELLGKAGKVEDILAIEENIRTLQEEIESQEGHLKYLDDQVTYSTLDVTLFQLKEMKIAEVKKESFGQSVKLAIGHGGESVLLFVLWMIRQWPWLIITMLVFIMLLRYIKRRRNRTYV